MPAMPCALLLAAMMPGHRGAVPAAVGDGQLNNGPPTVVDFHGHPVARVGRVGVTARAVRCRAGCAVVLPRRDRHEVVAADETAGQIVVREFARVNDRDNHVGTAGAVPRAGMLMPLVATQMPLAGKSGSVGWLGKEQAIRHNQCWDFSVCTELRLPSARAIGR